MRSDPVEELVRQYVDRIVLEIHDELESLDRDLAAARDGWSGPAADEFRSLCAKMDQERTELLGSDHAIGLIGQLGALF